MSNALEQFGRDLRNYLGKLPREIGRAVVQEAADNFKRQGSEDDTGAVVPWEPRKVAKEHGRTRKDGGRDRRYKNPRQRALLVQSGRLKRSVRIVSTTATTVTVGSSEPYAEAQQDGNERGLPARPFITFGRSAQQKLLKKVATQIAGMLK